MHLASCWSSSSFLSFHYSQHYRARSLHHVSKVGYLDPFLLCLKGQFWVSILSSMIYLFVFLIIHFRIFLNPKIQKNLSPRFLKVQLTTTPNWFSHKNTHLGFWFVLLVQIHILNCSVSSQFELNSVTDLVLSYSRLFRLEPYI